MTAKFDRFAYDKLSLETRIKMLCFSKQIIVRNLPAGNEHNIAPVAKNEVLENLDFKNHQAVLDGGYPGRKFIKVRHSNGRETVEDSSNFLPSAAIPKAVA